MSRLLVLTLALAGTASAQQFVDETSTRFPVPNPAEYSHEVEIGDIDNDGDLDLFFANANGYDKGDAPAQSRLYLNNGKGVFADETAERLGLGPAYVRDGDLVDVDGDGWRDLVLAGAFGDPPRLLRNQGGGFFKDESAARLPAYDGWWGASVACGDVDGDGDFDLYYTNAGTSMFAVPGGQDKLYVNDGKGVFTDVTKKQLPPLVSRATIGALMEDVDNDGDLDVLVNNRDVANELLLNDGAGLFTNGTYLLAPDGPHSYEIEAGDLDGDGWLDLFVTNGSPKSGSVGELVLINAIPDGKGFFDVTSLVLPTDANPEADDNASALFDLDDDGDFDIVVGAISPGIERVLINDGQGKLSALGNVLGGPGDSTLDLEVGDLDGDGRPDIVTAQGESGDFQNRVYHNTGPVDTHPPVVGPVVVEGPYAPYLGPLTVLARVRDAYVGDEGPRLQSVMLGDQPMAWAGGSQFRGSLAVGLVITPVQVAVTAQDPGKLTATSTPVTVAPRSPLDVFFDGAVDDKDLGLMVDHLVDKGGLGPEGDLDGDKDVDLGDAQLLAAGIGGAPTLSRVRKLPDGQVLLVGANFGASPTVLVAGVDAPVTAHGPVSLLCTPPAGQGGPFTVTTGGVASNPLLEVAP